MFTRSVVKKKVLLVLTSIFNVIALSPLACQKSLHGFFGVPLHFSEPSNGTL